MQNFAEEFQKVRAMDTKGKFKKQLKNIESHYQDIFLKTLSRFHNDMVYSKLPDKLHNIKEKLTDKKCDMVYQTVNSLNLDIQRCRNCKTETLNHMEGTNELCCQNCGLLETVEGTAFDYNEIYQYGDYKVTKQKRSNRKYNFKYFLEKHVKDCAAQGFVLSCDTIQLAREFFTEIDSNLPRSISFAFIAFKIFQKIAKDNEWFILKYFLMLIPPSSMARYEILWEDMLRHYLDSRWNLHRPMWRPLSNSGEMISPHLRHWRSNSGKWSLKCNQWSCILIDSHTSFILVWWSSMACSNSAPSQRNLLNLALRKSSNRSPRAGCKSMGIHLVDFSSIG